MPRAKSQIPTYRRHKQSGQAIVSITLPNGKRKDCTLGKYGSADSKAEYRRICAMLDAGNGQLPGHSDGVTINEIALQFLRHAMKYYRLADGTHSSEVCDFKHALRILREFFGSTPAAEFGPLAIKTVRAQMIKKGWARSTINAQVGRIKRVFKWASSEELIPSAVFHGLQTVSGLMAGRTEARETEPVKPVDEAVVEATLPLLNRHVAGMVRFQLLTGCRPGEVCQLRRADIEASGPVWLYRPVVHKMAYRGKDRVIAIGPKAQVLLAEFPTEREDDWIFSPAIAVAERIAARAAARKTPRYASHQRRNLDKRKMNPVNPPGQKYDVCSYRRAIAKGIEIANGKRAEEDQIPSWHPNQLRHTFATMIRKRFGLEEAQVSLGHSRADVTQIYAERNLELAAKVANEVG